MVAVLQESKSRGILWYTLPVDAVRRASCRFCCTRESVCAVEGNIADALHCMRRGTLLVVCVGARLDSHTVLLHSVFHCVFVCQHDLAVGAPKNRNGPPSLTSCWISVQTCCTLRIVWGRRPWITSLCGITPRHAGIWTGGEQRSCVRESCWEEHH